jgi:lysophospholipase L1-like esterase
VKFKPLIVFGVLLACVVWLAVQNQRLQAHLDLALSYQSQLHELSESNAQQRLQFESEISDFNEQLSSATYQVSYLSSTLQKTLLQVDPNYDALLQQARDQVAQQTSQTQPSTNGTAFASFTDPDNARARANESMPKLYDSYLNALGIPGTERQQIMGTMVDFGAQRYQMLDELLAGSMSPDLAVALFGANALSENLQNSLTATQQVDLRQYDQLLKFDTLREVYQQSLRNTGTALEGAIQEKVTQALIDEVVSAENNWGALVAEDGSMRSAHNDRLAAFDRARDALEPDLNTQQLEHLDRFIETQSSGIDVILEASSDGSGRVSITQARLGVENLPH